MLCWLMAPINHSDCISRATIVRNHFVNLFAGGRRRTYYKWFIYVSLSINVNFPRAYINLSNSTSSQVSVLRPNLPILTVPRPGSNVQWRYWPAICFYEIWRSQFRKSYSCIIHVLICLMHIWGRSTLWSLSSRCIC